MTKKVPKEKLDKILRDHVWASIGVGLVPVPGADLAGLLGIQLNMLRKIAAEYDVPFLGEAAKKILTSMIGARLLSVSGAGTLAASMVKAVPIIGQTLGSVTMPAISGATTYASGKVFISHFDSGGNFRTFDPDKMKAYYDKMFNEGKKVAAEIKKTQGQN